MQTILSEEQIKLLDFHHINYNQFTNDEKLKYPRHKSQFKSYGMSPKVAWDADSSILLLAWLNVQDSKHNELADKITYALNFEYYMNAEDHLDVEMQSKSDINNFYIQLSELKDFQFLAWFFCHTDSILKIYKYDASRFIHMILN